MRRQRQQDHRWVVMGRWRRQCRRLSGAVPRGQRGPLRGRCRRRPRQSQLPAAASRPGVEREPEAGGRPAGTPTSAPAIPRSTSTCARSPSSTATRQACRPRRRRMSVRHLAGLSPRLLRRQRRPHGRLGHDDRRQAGRTRPSTAPPAWSSAPRARPSPPRRQSTGSRASTSRASSSPTAALASRRSSCAIAAPSTCWLCCRRTPIRRTTRSTASRSTSTRASA